jgi:pyrroline-5-carboxylate reductase
MTYEREEPMTAVADTTTVASIAATVTADDLRTLVEARNILNRVQKDMRNIAFDARQPADFVRRTAYVDAKADTAADAICDLVIAVDVYLDTEWEANAVLNGKDPYTA